MFQYAFGLALRRHGQDVTFDISFLKDAARQAGCTPRSFCLDAFDIKENWSLDASLEELQEWREFPENVYDEASLNLQGMRISGYFQCWRYCDGVRAELLERFRLRRGLMDEPYEILRKEIEAHNSVAVHVRRGDYVTLGGFFHLCTVKYYQQAAMYIRDRIENLTFYVFSDDIEWCRRNLAFLGDVKYVQLAGANVAARELSLMASCKHNIIANSSFSWWGAWLNENPDKIVVAPYFWFSNGAVTEIIPPQWVRMLNVEWHSLDEIAKYHEEVSKNYMHIVQSSFSSVRAELSSVRAELSRTRDYSESLCSSIAYRTGRVLTSPGRVMKRFLGL